MRCVYGTDEFVSRTLEKMRPKASLPILRTQLYYLVCIVLRLALYNLVFLLREEWYTPVIVGVFSILSMINLYSSAFQHHQPQWWSKRFQFIMSLLVLVACVLTHYRRIPTWVVPVLLYSSIMGGLVQRWTCCCH